MRTSKIGTFVSIVLAGSVAVGGIALADTQLGDGDVAVLGSGGTPFSATNPAALTRAGSAVDVGVTLRADDGKIPTTQCEHNTVTTKRDWVVTSSGLAYKPDAGTYSNPTVSATFTCNQVFTPTSPESRTLAVKVFAGSDAPLGYSEPTITIGTAATDLVKLTTQIVERTVTDDGEAPFVDPKLSVRVDPRAASALTAVKDLAQPQTIINVSWARSPDHGDITSYIVSRDGVALGAITPATGSGTTQGFADTGRAAGTEYCYTVMARYTAGNVHYDSTVFPVSPTTACETTSASTATYTVDFNQPIDGGNIFNKGKLGRVIPVKVTLKLNGVALTDGTGGPLTIGSSTVSCNSNAPSDPVEEYSPGSSDHGSEFRFADGQWIYNLDTSKLPNAAPNSCAKVFVLRDQAVIGSFQIQLTK